MNYYEIHEQAYKELKKQGHQSWDQFLGQASDFESFSKKEPMALELGCGTGPVSYFLVKNGFKNVDGIDISSTAVEVAKEQAKLRNFKANFEIIWSDTTKVEENNHPLSYQAICKKNS